MHETSKTDEFERLATYFGLENLRDRYMLRDADGKVCEDPRVLRPRGNRSFVATRVLPYGVRLHDALLVHPRHADHDEHRHKQGLRSRVSLTRFPTRSRASSTSIEKTPSLSKCGGGVGTDWSQLRGQNAPLKASGSSHPASSRFKIMDSVDRHFAQLDETGAAACLRIDHPDIEDFWRFANRPAAISTVNV